MPYPTRLTLYFWTVLACSACSLDASGTLRPGDSGIDVDDDGISGSGGSSNTSGTSGGVGTGGSTGSLPPPVGPGPGPDASVGSDAGGQDSDAGDEPEDSLVGDYAQRRAFRTTQKVQSGAVNSTIRVLTTTYAVVRIAKENGKYRFYERACRIATETEPEGTLKVAISIEDAVPRSLPEVSSALTVAGSSSKQTFSRPLVSTALGWEPSSPSDLIPTMQKDARVRDSDGDGKPGVTASVRSGVGVLGDSKYDAYYVQWNRTRYEGEVASDGKLVGVNFDTTEQRVVGTSATLPSAGGTNAQPAPDSNTIDNRITLVPLSEALDCDDLVAQIDSIF